MEITFRHATPEDATTIGQIHAQSWKNSYKGILTDQYLNHEVDNDLNQKWVKRFQQPNSKQFTLLAEENGKPLGFVCTMLEAHQEWGALLDNLHVLDGNQGKGLGAYLLYASAKWVYQQAPNSDMYLYVYVDNPAKHFYERVGGIQKEKTTVDNPGGGQADIFRYSWPNLKQWLTDYAYIEKRNSK